MSTRSRHRAAVAALVVALFPAAIGVAWLRVLFDGANPSKAIGTVNHGRIEHAHVIPPCALGA